VTPAGDRIQVRFTWRGQELRPTLALKPTAANLAHARRLRRQVVEEIRDGVFVLAKHFPDYKFAGKVAPEGEAEQRTMRDWAKVWKELSARSVEHSTLAIYWRHLNAYWLPALGDLLPRRITRETILRQLATLAAERVDPETGETLKPLGRKTQNNIMIPLRGVLALACSTLKLSDPTEGIDNLKVQKPDPDPFTLEEVEIILTKLRELEGEAMADWFEFAFFAGLRSSEQVALPWADVDLRTMTVIVRGAQVMGKAKDRTKTHRERVVELNDRAAAVLVRQRARTQAQRHGKVFGWASDPSHAWRDEQVQWRAWARVMKLTGVRYRAPKECRDTSVTLALQAGASPVWVAAQHGHSVQVMLTSYAKWIPSADRGRNRSAVNAALTAPAKGAAES